MGLSISLLTPVVGVEQFHPANQGKRHFPGLFASQGQPEAKSSLSISVPQLQIDIAPDHHANREQVTRAYVAGTKWFRGQLAHHNRDFYPQLTVKIGVINCPAKVDACFDHDSHAVYISKWDRYSAQWVFQATVYAGTTQFLEPRVITQAGSDWWIRDSKLFLDAPYKEK